MTRKTCRPTCVGCGERLGRTIVTVHIPFDADNLVDAAHAALRGLRGGVFLGGCWIVDSADTVLARQAERRERYNNHLQQLEEARALLSNPPENPTISQRSRLATARAIVDTPDTDPRSARWGVPMRVWLGSYGPDGRSLFHSKTCAARWANRTASRLRQDGAL
jgi:hypothetical protein